jgi:hypothetical protein
MRQPLWTQASVESAARPIVLESKGDEVPDLKDRSVEHTAFLAVPLDLGGIGDFPRWFVTGMKQKSKMCALPGWWSARFHR